MLGRLQPNGTTIRVREPNLDPADIVFELASTFFLWLLIPGCGFFYSGLSGPKSAATLILLSFWSAVVVSLQWFLFGYSLSFSPSRYEFIGNFERVGLIGVYDQPYDGVGEELPEVLFCIYQGVTAMLAPALLLGVIAERGRLVPAITFVFIWTTLAYDPICYWTLNPRGWLVRLGALDFGGGSPVHCPAAGAALAYALILGPRLRAQIKEANLRPHNMSSVLFGTTLIWLGTMGNNAGSAFAADLTGVMTIFTTNLSGSAGAITWSILDYQATGTLSALGFCSGAVAGLICVIPGSGFISPTSSLVFGILGALGSNLALRLSTRYSDKFEDTLEILTMHGTSGVLGNILTGVLAEKPYGGRHVKDGGWINGHWIQVPIQALLSLVAFSWSFGIAYAALFCMDKTPWLRLRLSPESERREGQDESEVGVKAYEFLEGSPGLIKHCKF